MRTTALVYGHVASNLGDLAINDGFRELCLQSGLAPPEIIVTRKARPKYKVRMKEALPEAQLRESFPAPKLDTPEARIKEILTLSRAVLRPELWAHQVGLDQADVIFANAGEHLYESPTGDNLLDLYWRVLPLVAAASIGRPGIQLPATIGPFLSRDGYLALETIQRVAKSWAVRDCGSRNYLAELPQGLSQGQAPAPLLLDPAFFLNNVTIRAASTPTIAIIPRLEKFGMRVGARSSRYAQSKAKAEGFRSSVAFRWALSVGEHYLQQGWNVDLYVQTDNDQPLMDAIHEELGQLAGRGQEVSLFAPSSVAQYRRSLGRAHRIVSSRFHACIFGLSLGIPSVGIYHESHWKKMPGLFALLGERDQAIQLPEEGPVEHDSVLRALERSVDSQGGIDATIVDKKTETANWVHEAANASVKSVRHEDLRDQILTSLDDMLGDEIQQLEDTWTSRVDELLAKVDRRLDESSAHATS